MEAVELTLQNHYDLVLMDVNMPRQDGLQSTAQYCLYGGLLNARIRDREERLGIQRSFICGKPLIKRELMLAMTANGPTKLFPN